MRAFVAAFSDDFAGVQTTYTLADDRTSRQVEADIVASVDDVVANDQRQIQRLLRAEGGTRKVRLVCTVRLNTTLTSVK